MARNTLSAPPQQPREQEPNAVTVKLGRTADQNTPRNIGLIVEYEYKKRLTQRSFIISTIIILILIALGSCVPTVIQYITATSNSQTKMAVVNNAGPIAGMNDDQLLSYIEKTLSGTANQSGSTNASGQSTSGNPRFAITLTSTNDIAPLKNSVQDGSISILLVLNRTSNQDVGFTYYTSANPINDTNASQVQGLASQLSLLDRSAHIGLTTEQTGNLFAPPSFSTVNVGQTNRSVSAIATGYILAYVGVILIFMSVYLYGYWVATGVAEEKGSRIMEILVNAATPFQLMAGKILGIGAAGLTQMATFVIVGIGAFLLQNPIKAALLGNNTGGLSLDITGGLISLLLWLLVYFILGFLLYASIFAAVGALVKRQEEVQNAIQFPMWLIMIGYFVSFFGISTPDAPWVKVISYIPFWTPTTMLMRLGVGNVAWWEILLTIVLMIIAIFICTVISARIYRFGALMYGQKPRLSKLVRLVGSK
ncbi:MAG TPA: ABC transporter permease [Ktedonobacteraceae bacterium]|nr:ABC transporter permease [Ktedonobacteraceae bacterium]